MQYSYRPQGGVCSTEMVFTIEAGIVRALSVRGGCDGNLRGLSRLVEGMPVETVIAKLEGLPCGGKPTSCPDQLARALKQTLEGVYSRLT